MSCAFCTDASSTGEIVHAGPDGWVIVHPDWSVRGHVMIVSAVHAENPSGLDAAEWARFAALWHRAEGVLLELTGCERAIAMKLGILTPHLHVHLYPVSSASTREEVFAAIDGKARVDRDERLVAELRSRLS